MLRLKFGIIDADTFRLIIEPLYFKIEGVKRKINDFQIFSVFLKNGEKVYVGENGVAFFSD